MQLRTNGFIVVIVAVVFIGPSQSLKDYISKDPWRGIPMVCSSEDPKNISVSCHGVRIVKRVIQELLDQAVTSSSIKITQGVDLVDSIDTVTRRARTMKNPILGFLEDRELRIKLSSFVPKALDSTKKTNLSEGRGRGDGGLGLGGNKKGGNNSFLLLALMMGKTLGAVGFGALGLLTMKALMASSLALMLSLIVAAKKFSSSDKSSDGGRHVVYAQESSHHHTKRSMDLSPYRGWLEVPDFTKTF